MKTTNKKKHPEPEGEDKQHRSKSENYNWNKYVHAERLIGEVGVYPPAKLSPYPP